MTGRCGRRSTFATCRRAYSSVSRDRSGPHIKGLAMADKSPRSSMSKKSGKSLKEKRADKRTEGDQASPTDKLLNRKKN
jgi:hypothetical protein